MSTAGLQLESLAINSHSREEAFRLRNEELWMTARKLPNVIIVGPEQLRAKALVWPFIPAGSTRKSRQETAHVQLSKLGVVQC